jgi:hypothetical protein
MALVVRSQGFEDSGRNLILSSKRRAAPNEPAFPARAAIVERHAGFASNPAFFLESQGHYGMLFLH